MSANLSNPQYLSSACDPKHSCTKELVNLRAGAVTQQNNSKQFQYYISSNKSPGAYFPFPASNT